jgi:aerobic-type carbon monoxide dehydrogenase small subunit (CoxS/CutS family)
MNIKFKLNGENISIDVASQKRLVDILREDMGLTGTKEGCAIGECGACTVIMNGDTVSSCMILPPQIDGNEVETIEGLEANGEISELQKAFLENGGVQCGFCTPGMLMSGTALLRKNPSPTEEEIREALEGNLCRCTGYIPIINSIKSVIK